MKYCFDLDGTLCNINGNDYKTAIPIKERIEIVNNLFDKGHFIIIESARGSLSQFNWFISTKQQLEKWGLKYNQLRVGNKIAADLYIDDKGISDVNFFKKF